MKIETPLAPSKGMEKRGPGRVNCQPLKDINAYAGGSSLFLFVVLSSFANFLHEWKCEVTNQSKQFLLNKLPNTIRFQQNLGKR